jgi:uncharacterized protein DUF6632
MKGSSMNAIINNGRRPGKGLAFKVFLRVYGVLTLIIFGLLIVGFLAQSPLLAEHGGALNWTIWNDVRCGNEHMHVPPMLMVIYIVWGVFLLLAAAHPYGYASFLRFTAWANLAHGGLMIVQAATELDKYWSKFLTDIPFVMILAVGILVWARGDKTQAPGRDVPSTQAMS